jgi:hypothetical protein
MLLMMLIMMIKVMMMVIVMMMMVRMMGMIMMIYIFFQCYHDSKHCYQLKHLMFFFLDRQIISSQYPSVTICETAAMIMSRQVNLYAIYMKMHIFDDFYSILK